MSKPSLWNEYENLCGDSVSLVDLFNYFDSDQLEEFLEHIKDEKEN